MCQRLTTLKHSKNIAIDIGYYEKNIVTEIDYYKKKNNQTTLIKSETKKRKLSLYITPENFKKCTKGTQSSNGLT